MKYLVSLTSRAELDRDTAFHWYAENYSNAFAIRWFNEITRAMRSLSKNPERCHKAAEDGRFSFDVYELFYGRRRNKHRILFRIYRDVVLVLHIRHAAQRELEVGDL
jgi:plasmid stabilization system protein ParE